jgi:hypothetical protein
MFLDDAPEFDISAILELLLGGIGHLCLLHGTHDNMILHACIHTMILHMELLVYLDVDTTHVWL